MCELVVSLFVLRQQCRYGYAVKIAWTVNGHFRSSFGHLGLFRPEP